MPSPNGRRTDAISMRLKLPSSGLPHPRSARPNYVEYKIMWGSFDEAPELGTSIGHRST